MSRTLLTLDNYFGGLAKYIVCVLSIRSRPRFVLHPRHLRRRVERRMAARTAVDSASKQQVAVGEIAVKTTWCGVRF